MSAKRAALAAQIAALRAQMEAEDEPGIYEEPNGFFRIVRLPGGRQTTRRRARDGSRLPSRDQAVRAKAPNGRRPSRPARSSSPCPLRGAVADVPARGQGRDERRRLGGRAHARRAAAAALPRRHAGQPLDLRRHRGLARRHARAGGGGRHRTEDRGQRAHRPHGLLPLGGA